MKMESGATKPRGGCVAVWALCAILALASPPARAQCTWDWINPRPTGSRLTHVAYSESVGLLVAVGDAGSILTSSDGTAWTIRESGTHVLLSDILWDGTQFVAVSPAEASLTSTDGISWAVHPVAPPSPFDRFFVNAVASNGTTLVAVTEAGRIFTSLDGISWLLQASGTTERLVDVIWDGGRFVAITSGGDVLTSSDGTVWTSSASTGIGMNALAWNGSLYVALGAQTITTSPDAVVWTPQVTPGSQYYTDVTWSGSEFVATSSSGAGTARSADGFTWEAVAVVGRLSGILWDGSQFVAVGFAGRIGTSPDGSLGSWVDRFTTPVTPSTNAFNDVAWDGDRFLATLANSVFTSGDGQLWTRHIANLSLNLWRVASNGNTFVAVDLRGTAVHYHSSTDGGETWTTTVSSRDPSLVVWDVLWTGTQFIAVGSELRYPGSANQSSRLPYYAVSIDGITWTETVLTSPDVTPPDAPAGGGGGFRAIATDGSRLVAVGGRVLVDPGDPVNSPLTGLIMYSDDGGLSFHRSLPDAAVRRVLPYADIAWDGSQFVVVEDEAGSTSAVWTSPSADDGDWAVHPTSLTDDSIFVAIDLVNSAGDLLIVGTSKIGGATPFYTSPDGTSWTTTEYFPSNKIQAIATNGTRVVAVGGVASILTTDCFSPSGFAQAEIVSPIPESTFTSSSVTFTWDAKGNMADQWILHLGSSVGASDIDMSGPIPGTDSSFTFNGLPTDGRTIYARLIMDIGGAETTQDDEVYTAWTAPPTATIIAPIPGTTLEDNSETFVWDPMGVTPDHWVVWIGTTQGGNELVSSGSLPVGTTTFSYAALPTDGTPVWVRLWAEDSGILTAQDDAGYDTAFPAKAQILSPRPGSKLGETAVMVTWNLTGFDPTDQPRIEIFDETHSFFASSFSLPPGTSHHTFTTVFTGDPDETFANLPTDGRPLFLFLRRDTGPELVSQDVEMYWAFAPADFYTVSPCRLIDTRNPNGALGGPALVTGLTRTFTVAGACGVPLTARALSVNVVATGSTAPGNIRLFPGDSAIPQTSSINYTLGATRSNNGIIGLSSFGELAAFVGGPPGTVHLIVDINGYFE
jgi:hypothetical protein